MKTRNLLVFAGPFVAGHILHEKMAHFNGNAFQEGCGTRKGSNFWDIYRNNDIKNIKGQDVFK
jgi:hypothetical protein